VYVHPSAPGLTCELLPTVRSLFLALRDHHAVAATAPGLACRQRPLSPLGGASALV